jgi:hypothetical protein
LVSTGKQSFMEVIRSMARFGLLILNKGKWETNGFE